MATFTSRKEIEAIASQLFIDVRVDDDDDGAVSTAVANNEEAHVEEAIEDATDEMMSYLNNHYDECLAAENRWVRRKASWIAAHYISRRRGNPSQFLDQYESIITDLEKVHAAKKQVPKLATHANFLPTMSNQIVDRSYHSAKLRTEPVISIGGTHSSQHLSYCGSMDWYSAGSDSSPGSSGSSPSEEPYRTQGDDWELRITLNQVGVAEGGIDTGSTVVVAIVSDSKSTEYIADEAAAEGHAQADWPNAIVGKSFTAAQTVNVPPGPQQIRVTITESGTTCTYYVPFQVRPG